MRVVHKISEAEIRTARQLRYLKSWPIEKQLEALTENSMGRPEKLNKLREDFTKIREALQFFKEGE